MKLYVWVNPFKPSYGGSVIYAVADTLEQAKKLALTSERYAFGFHAIDDYPINELGEPDRILECPCAECYWHEE
jgi:hypothetical protein